MARTTAPLFSMDASGTVAGALVFSRWRGRNYVRRHAIPSNPRTGLQVGVRSAFKFLSQWWASFNPTEQGLWTDVGNVTRITGLNAFIAENVRRIREGRPFQYDPTLEVVAACDNLATFTGGALARAVSLTWTYVAPVEPAWGIFIWMKPAAQPTQTISYLINASPVVTTQLVITGLTPGIAYHFRAITFGFENSLGTLAFDLALTPDA